MQELQTRNCQLHAQSTAGNTTVLLAGNLGCRVWQTPAYPEAALTAEAAAAKAGKLLKQNKLHTSSHVSLPAGSRAAFKVALVTKLFACIPLLKPWPEAYLVCLVPCKLQWMVTYAATAASTVILK